MLFTPRDSPVRSRKVHTTELTRSGRRLCSVSKQRIKKKLKTQEKLSWPVLVPPVYVPGFSLGSVVDSPVYLPLVTVTPAAGYQSTPIKSLMSHVPSIKVTFPELITILCCWLSACGSCLNRVLTRKESCRLFGHYYVLKERDQDHDPVAGVVIHASAALVTSTLCLLSLGGRSVTSNGPTGIFEVLTLNLHLWRRAKSRLRLS